MNKATTARTARNQTNRRSMGGRKSPRRTANGQGSATGAVMAAVNEAVSSGLTDSLNAMKTRIGERISDNGEKYLNDASERINEVTAKVVKWGKEHPVKTAAAAAALIAVSTFLYSTLGKSSGGGKRGNR
jgi:hypothetical protein